MAKALLISVLFIVYFVNSINCAHNRTKRDGEEAVLEKDGSNAEPNENATNNEGIEKFEGFKDYDPFQVFYNVLKDIFDP
ncbi:hypothetical protein RR46_02299 [Papilio xuthus]|uniref:Uncharacterized protein n=1 Tax=Papilio xuthus TaxID=66420 RepID=A0A194QJS0_PAPXU|nr:hypothetical protein RR46_02299 [Papilio xuthus]